MLKGGFMQNIRLTVQYDGTRYLGWQRPEKDGYNRTISFRIARVLTNLTGEDVLLFTGAKTEPGVHAEAQTVNFTTNCTLSPAAFASALNQYLPSDIAVLHAECAPQRFRADLNAHTRTYEFRCCTSPVQDPFLRNYTAHIFPAPDVELMKEAAALLIGKHDFHTFSPVRKKKGGEKEIQGITFSHSDNLLTIQLTASDFLYQMPGRIVGTLLEAGLRLRSPDSLSAILTGTEKAGASCEPKGLLLKNIQYKQDQNNSPAR